MPTVQNVDDFKCTDYKRQVDSQSTLQNKYGNKVCYLHFFLLQWNLQ